MIGRVTQPEGWNENVLRLGGNFLQSWEWGMFQEKIGAEVLRFKSEEGAAQVLRRSLPFGQSYWYCPRGPLGRMPDLRPELPGGVVFRCEPAVKTDLPGARKVAAVQPEQTLVVDLRPEREALLAAMHEKWRYNIRLAERKDVRVYMPGPADTPALEVFLELMGETTERDRFHAHDKTYYRLMLETLAGDPATDAARRPVARLAFAERDGKILAANLMLYFGKTVTYLHGASSRARREVMAPQLLQWTCMSDAKTWGFQAYDFWGVAPEGAERHPWAGITRFKRGFGGKYVEYPGTYDLPMKRFWYTLYRLARRRRP